MLRLGIALTRRQVVVAHMRVAVHEGEAAVAGGRVGEHVVDAAFLPVVHDLRVRADADTEVTHVARLAWNGCGVRDGRVKMEG